MSFDAAMERNFYRARLIALVHANPLLWDKTTVDFNNRMAKMRKWMEVSTELGVSTDKIRRTWENLRDQFRRDLKRQLKYGTRSKWRFYDDMVFIRNMVRVKELNETGGNSGSESEELDTYDINHDYEGNDLSAILSTSLTTTAQDVEEMSSSSSAAAAAAAMHTFKPIQLSTEWDQVTTGGSGTMNKTERRNYQSYQRDQVACREMPEQTQQQYVLMKQTQQQLLQEQQHQLRQLQRQRQQQQKLLQQEQLQEEQRQRHHQQLLQQEQLQEQQRQQRQQLQQLQADEQHDKLLQQQKIQQKCDSSDETKFDVNYLEELPEIVKIEIDYDSNDQDFTTPATVAVTPEIIVPIITHTQLTSTSQEACVTTSASTSSEAAAAAQKRRRQSDEAAAIKDECASNSKKIRLLQQDSELPDEDYHFVMSILPSLRQISRNRKFPLRMSIMNLISKELEESEQD